MKFKILLFSTAFLAGNVFAQNRTTIRLDFVSPGIGAEFGIAPSSTIYTNLGLSPLLFLGFQNGGGVFQPLLPVNPTLEARYHFYLNFRQRENAGKSIFGNSGNYLGFGTAVRFVPVREMRRGLFGPDRTSSVDVFLPFGAGIQRTYKNRLYLNVFAGGLYSFTRDSFAPHLSFKFGFTLFQ